LITSKEISMVDSMTSLAISVYSSRGVYALLLGSGISRSSGIPTGWEIVLDLIRKVAQIQGEDCGDDPAAWYQAKYKKEPDYSDLLGEISRESAERQQLLRTYFEPTEEEREQGKKTPTPAHKAIAQLVAGGYLRVIITTNFDQLLERALHEAGVVPTVIASPNSIQGAMPSPHSPCTVIKVHGDYIDTRLKNTRAELEQYDDAMNRLLDRVFDEYGLIVCGWSADWDIALRAAIERCPNRRFTTFWAAYRGVAGAAKRLCDLRLARDIPGQDADTFFRNLAEKIKSLVDMEAQRPLTTPIAVATLKQYLAEDRYRIRLRDLVVGEAKRVKEELRGERFPFALPLSSVLAERIPRYEAAVKTLLAMMITGVYWGGKSQRALWVHCLERVARPTEGLDGDQRRANIGLYPVLLLYGCGIAAVSAGQYITLYRLLTQDRSMILGEEKDL
jgi:hypothetical protein